MQIESRYSEPSLFPENENSERLSTTFSDNMSLPIHRWYRYTAGFSAAWVNQLISREKVNHRNKIIDPFAGSGTVLIESELLNVRSYGIESHPYVYKIAKSKLSWNYPAAQFKENALAFLGKARKKKLIKREHSKLIQNCYPQDTISKLDALKHAWLESDFDEDMAIFIWFAITSILRVTSPVGTAQWQYILPSKRKARVIDPFEAFERKITEMFEDMINTQRFNPKPTKSRILNEDSRNIKSIPEGWGNLVITSPPYANNYDYADATRLEMTFWGDIKGWSDLQAGVRKNLIRACTQHVSGMGQSIDEILESERLQPIKEELLVVYDKLKLERLNHGGKKNYHWMIAAYFKDLADVMHSLRRVTEKNCLMCFVIGDSAPYGVYVPVDTWLGELAVSAGFQNYNFEKLRDRNIKWKNRKHRVPLKEGRLWING